MKVLDAKVNWYEEYRNPPTLQITVDKIPENLIYIDKHPYYYGEKEGFVSFYYYSKPDDGYGGREFHINTDKGLKVLKGPWSSNAISMFCAGFPISYNVAIKDISSECKNLLYSGHLTEKLWLEAISLCKDADAVKVKTVEPYSKECESEQNLIIGGKMNGKEVIYYQIASKGMTFNQSQNYKDAKK